MPAARDTTGGETTVEWYVRDTNGNLQGPWCEEACREDVASGQGGVQVLRRTSDWQEVPADE